MNVKALIKELKKMPQDLEVGYVMHDYDCGDSEHIKTVQLLTEDEIENDSGVAMHKVVLAS